MTPTTLLLEQASPHILLVTLNRPEVSNALNTQMALDLTAVFDGLNADPSTQRCVVVTGAGARAFCGGGDLKQRLGMDDAAWMAQHIVFERMVRAMHLCPVPMIAAVNGAAYGGGCEIALCCDFIYAAEHARFAMSEVTLGIMPGAGGTQNLARALGTRRAKEMLLTGNPLAAREALEWGLVNRVCAADSVVAEAMATATRIAGNAPLSTRQIKQSVEFGARMDLSSALMFEIEAYNRLVPTQDRREGVAAFNEKRMPVFQGR